VVVVVVVVVDSGVVGMVVGVVGVVGGVVSLGVCTWRTLKFKLAQISNYVVMQNVTTCTVQKINH
jgi:hypothetical protein